MYYKITVILQPQPEGVYTVTCKELPELITEGRTIEEALYNAEDAFSATLEIYREFILICFNNLEVRGEQGCQFAMILVKVFEEIDNGLIELIKR